MLASEPLQCDAAQLKINFGTPSSPAVASWVNCLNIYSAFQTVCSAFHAAPTARLPDPETTSCNLTGTWVSCLMAAAVRQVPGPGQGTYNLRSLLCFGKISPMVSVCE